MKTRLMAIIVLLCLSSTGKAGIISGTHYTADGKLVNLGGLEWLTWDATYGVSRNTIEADYGGFLSDGWQYATNTEYTNFIHSLMGPHSGGNEGNYDGSQWVWENFDNPDFIAPTTVTSSGDIVSRTGYIFLGADGTCSADLSLTCYTSWRATSTGSSGRLSNVLGVTSKDTISVPNYYSPGSHVLVRAAGNVPIPATIALFGIGLAGLGWSMRKRA